MKPTTYQQLLETLPCVNSILATLGSTCGCSTRSTTAKTARFDDATSVPTAAGIFLCSSGKYIFSSCRTDTILLGLIPTYFMTFVCVTSIERILPYHISF